MPIVDAVEIVGFAQLRKALRALGSEGPKALRIASNEAAQLVVDTARAGMPSRSGKARASVKVRSTQTAARVTEGGNRAPYVPWLDYGGKVGRNNTAKRVFIADGRYVYPAYRERKAEFEPLIRESVVRIAADAGLDLEG